MLQLSFSCSLGTHCTLLNVAIEKRRTRKRLHSALTGFSIMKGGGALCVRVLYACLMNEAIPSHRILQCSTKHIQGYTRCFLLTTAPWWQKARRCIDPSQAVLQREPKPHFPLTSRPIISQHDQTISLTICSHNRLR